MTNLYSLQRAVRFVMVMILCAYFLATPVAAQPLLSFTNILSGLSSPVDVVNAGDHSNRLFIVQKGGLIRIFNGTSLLSTPFLNLSTVIRATDSEQGLLSLAFHPNYEDADNGYFFVYYTRAADGAVTIARYRRSSTDANVADPNSGQVLLTVPKPAGRTNHNGGKLNFGSDGNLYFGIGDGGSGDDPDHLAQNGNALQGKMLRITASISETGPLYTIPSDNPYVSDPNVRDEVWIMGLRNPWRWSFDRTTGDMWIADVGQGAWEEVNFRPAASTGGLNYGWGCLEGAVVNPNYTGSCALPLLNYNPPIFVYPHNNTTGGFSITGGYVYRGNVYPSLRGYYITADYVSGNVWKIIPNGVNWNVTMQAKPSNVSNISGFGEGENGTIYAVSLSAGALFRVEVPADAGLPVKLTSFSGAPENGAIVLNWQTASEFNSKQYDVEYSIDGITFQTAGSVIATNNPNGSKYNFRHLAVNTARVYYRLKMIDKDDSYEYSNTISVTVTGAAVNYIYPTIVTTGMVSLYLSESFQAVEVVDVQGRVLVNQLISGRTGRIDIRLPASATGTNLVRVIGKDTQKSIIQKIIVRN